MKRNAWRSKSNAGAPRKSETEQSNLIFITALKEIKNVDNDEDARKESLQKNY
jgi:hypothetical protein